MLEKGGGQEAPPVHGQVMEVIIIDIIIIII